MNYRHELFILYFLWMLLSPFRVYPQIEEPKYTSSNPHVKRYLQMASLKEKEGDKKEATRFLNEAASVEWGNKNYPQAIEYFEQSVKLNEEIGNINGITMIHNNLGMIYADMGTYEKSLNYFLKTLESRRILKEKTGIISALINISVVLNNLKRYRESVVYLEEALDYAREMSDIIQMKSCYGMLSETYEKAGDVEKAYHFFELYRTFHEKIYSEKDKSYKKNLENSELKASLLDLEKRNKELEIQNKNKSIQARDEKIAELDAKTQNLLKNASRKELAIAYLQKEAENKKNNQKIKLLEIKQEKALISEKLRRENARKNYFLVALILLSLSGLWLLKNNLDRRRKNKVLNAQKNALKEANEVIRSVNVNLERIVEDRTHHLNEAYREIASTNKELDTFLYRSSHDLRRPLTTLMGLRELAKITIEDKAALDLFEKVNITALDMDKMLFKLIMLHDIQHHTIKKEKIDFEKLLKKINQDFLALLVHYKVDWQLEIQPKISAKTDAVIMDIILRNLIENAIYFSKNSEAFVKINLCEKGKKIMLSVKDNGIGISQQYHTKVFEMYFKASEKSHGNGLGLYVIKKALAKVSGKIRFESKPEQGSEFKVIIPCT